MVCTDAELVNRVCKGDIDAFSEIISKYANAVYGVAYGKLGDFHTAQDIAQEVFVKTFRKLSSLKEPENWEAGYMPLLRGSASIGSDQKETRQFII